MAIGGAPLLRELAGRLARLSNGVFFGKRRQPGIPEASLTLTTDQALGGLNALFDSSRDRIIDTFGHIHGGVGPEALPLIFFINQHQKHWEVKGHIAEIGIFHGLYLLNLGLMAEPGERVVGIDVFDMQMFNIDKAGDGVEAIVRSNIERFARHPERFDLIKADSTSFHSAKRSRAFVDRYGEFKIFSVDGCHLKYHTMADIAFGESMLANGGLLIVDDFTNDGWPGVADGTSAYFASRNLRLAPLVVAFNKLFCTTISHHQLYYDAISAWVAGNHHARFYDHAKEVPIYERPAWHFNQFKGL